MSENKCNADTFNKLTTECFSKYIAENIVKTHHNTAFHPFYFLNFKPFPIIPLSLNANEQFL